MMIPSRRRVFRRPRSRRGLAAIEFALTMPVLLAVILGIVELSLLIGRSYVVSRAARDGCRVGAGVLEGVDPTGEEIEQAATVAAETALAAAGINCDSTPCSISARWFQDDSGWYMVEVDVSVAYEPFSTFLPSVPVQTAYSFKMLTQQQVY